jgi:2-dehydropantoate 2-reductase
VTLRFEHLEAPSEEVRRAVRAPAGALLVVLSPVFPEQRPALEEALGGSFVSALPGASGYTNDRGVVRHWISPLVPTLVDEGEPADLALRRALVGALEDAGFAARLERDVERVSAATTTTFYPLIAAIAIAGSTEALAKDEELLQLVFAARDECRELAALRGTPAEWARIATDLLGPARFRVAMALMRRAQPELVRFLDVHFGPKLAMQHLRMGEAMVADAGAKGIAAPALRRLVAKLAA